MPVNIGRRELIAALGGTAAAWPVLARAQQPRMLRIGSVSSINPRSAFFWVAFDQCMRELGYIEGLQTVLDTLPSRPERCYRLVVEPQAKTRPVGQNQRPLLEPRCLFEQAQHPGHVLHGEPVRAGCTRCAWISGITWLTTGRLNDSAMAATFIHLVMPPTRARSIITMSTERASIMWRNGTMPQTYSPPAIGVLSAAVTRARPG